MRHLLCGATGWNTAVANPAATWCAPAQLLVALMRLQSQKQDNFTVHAVTRPCGNGLPSRQEQACMWPFQEPKVLHTQHIITDRWSAKAYGCPLPCNSVGGLHGMHLNTIAFTIATTYQTSFVAAPSSSLPTQMACMCLCPTRRQLPVCAKYWVAHTNAKFPSAKQAAQKGFHHAVEAVHAA